MRNWTAWIGAKYGTLTVEKYLGNQGTKNTFFLVRCDCGKTKKSYNWRLSERQGKILRLAEM